MTKKVETTPVPLDAPPPKFAQQPEADEALADTQRAIIEAAERRGYERAKAEQPASDGGFTAADMMDARQEGRKEAQQPAAVDEALRAEVDRWKSNYNAAIELKGRAFAESDRLAEALQWYAEQAEGCRKIGSIGEPFRKELDRDGGKRAREALRDHDKGESNAP